MTISLLLMMMMMMMLILLLMMMSLFYEIHGGDLVFQAPPSDTSNSGCASGRLILIFIFIFFAAPIASVHRIVRFKPNAEL
jgi:hypothetical protein